MSQLLLAIKAEVAEVFQHASALTKERIAHFESCYDGVIQAGLDTNALSLHPATKRRGRMKQSPPKNLLVRLDKRRVEVLAFMVNIPFDNNLAEHDIGMFMVKQDISGGLRTEEEVETICAIRSFLATAKK